MSEAHHDPSGLDIQAIRAQFPIVERIVYFNTGTAGVAPLPVAEATWADMRAFELDGEHGWGDGCQRVESGRDALADLLSAKREEIALTRNATDGVNLVVEGVGWRDGDEVLLSNEEHPSMLFPWTYLTQRRDVKLHRFDLGMTPEETLDNVRAAITPKTRLVATSHVSSVTGKRAPAKEIAALCREQGILTLFDGAQAVGQFPLNLPDIGGDFYTGNCHKWLLGPKGTGFLFVRRDSLDELTPTFVGAGSGGFDDDGLTPLDTAARFEYGTRDFGRYGGIAATMDWHGGLGIDREFARMRHLTHYLRGRLEELPGLTIHTPRSWEESSAMTTFSAPGHSAQTVFHELREQRSVKLRIVGEVDGNRISTAVFNTEEEVDTLIELLHPYASG